MYGGMISHSEHNVRTMVNEANNVHLPIPHSPIFPLILGGPDAFDIKGSPLRSTPNLKFPSFRF